MLQSRREFLKKSVALLGGSALADIFDTEFEFFRRGEQRRPYAVPRGFVS